MLQFIKIQHPDQIRSLLKEFNPEQQTWIVSDLKSKQEIQSECLTRFGFYADDAILRVSDFWRIWIRRLKPTLQVVSGDFIKSLLQIFISKFGAELELQENDQSTLEKYVQELAPIILHPESDSVLREWLQTQQNPRKWQKWYQIARVCLLYIVNEKKVIDIKWSAAYLQSLDLEKIHWPRELIVDLGTELTSVELGLFKVLSQKQNVQVYVPQPEWQNRFPFLLKTYSENFGFGQIRQLPFLESTYVNHKKFLRVSTQLAEVKFATSQVRQWLDQGVALDRIAIVALQIENYWPVLQSYLNEEGIPYQKDSVAALNSLAAVQTFIAHLKNYTSDVSFESLQQKLFHNQSKPEIKFEKFKSLFNQLFDEEDLKRDEKIKNLFYKKIDFQRDLARDEFISILLKVWSELPERSESTHVFALIFKDFLGQSLDLPMSYSNWFQFFRSRLSHKEIKISFGSQEGIQALSLMSAQLSTTDHRIYLGLFEEEFRLHLRSVLPLQDIETLKNQFDLAIPYPEESHLDFNLRWQVATSCQQIFLLCPHLSFSAEPLTPCLYFLENSPKSQLTSPGPTRLDEVQRSLAGAKGGRIDGYEKVLSQPRLIQDITKAEVKIAHKAFDRLTAGELESYAQCSFKLLATKGFRLRDLPEVSIDLDPRQKGILVHALFEFLIQEISLEQYDLQSAKAFLQSKREELNLFLNEDSFWQVQLNKLLLLAQKFYEFERFRIQHFKILTETSFEIHYDLEAKKFTSMPTKNSFAVRGRIDRIDQVKETNQYLIYDYKSSPAQTSSFRKWMSEYQFQLLIYLFAVEVSLFEKSQVRGALYYLYKNFDIGKGFVDQKLGAEKLGLSNRLGSMTEMEALDEVKNQFVEFMASCFRNLKAGLFSPMPYDKSICVDCDWRKLCRAQHLM